MRVEANKTWERIKDNGMREGGKIKHREHELIVDLRYHCTKRINEKRTQKKREAPELETSIATMDIRTDSYSTGEENSEQRHDLDQEAFHYRVP
jgi:hypothetical protein